MVGVEMAVLPVNVGMLEMPSRDEGVGERGGLPGVANDRRFAATLARLGFRAGLAVAIFFFFFSAISYLFLSSSPSLSLSSPIALRISFSFRGNKVLGDIRSRLDTKYQSNF